MRLVTNNAIGELASGITDVATSLTLKAGQGALFPAISGAPDHFFVTLSDSSNNIEIVKVTAIATDTLTIERAQDGTSNRAWIADDNVELAATANLYNSSLKVGMVRGFAAGAGGADAITATFANSTDSSLENGMTFLVEATATNVTTTPTFTVTLGGTAQSAKTIVKGNDVALTPGDIHGANYRMLLSYDSSLDKFILMNPYSQVINIETKSSLFTLAATDNGKMFDCTGTWTLTVPSAATLTADFYCWVYNSGTGVITLSTGEVVNPGEVVKITSDATNIRELRSSGGFTRMEVITATNAGWTVPDNVRRIKATVVGGGGGGGGFDTSPTASGGGGGGGGCAIKIVAVTPGETIAVTVGGGGGARSPSTSPSGGGTGGTSSFGSHCSATGGGGGGAGGYHRGGAGGVGSSGDLNLNGDGGLSGSYSNGLAGAGGGSFLGGGSFSYGPYALTASGTVYGGGGQGSNYLTNISGAGAAGVVILEY